MAQMTLTNVSNKVFTSNPFATRSTLNQCILTQIFDTMCIPEMDRNTAAGNLRTANLKATLTAPLAMDNVRAEVRDQSRGYKGICFGRFCIFSNLHHLGHRTRAMVLCRGKDAILNSMIFVSV